MCRRDWKSYSWMTPLWSEAQIQGLTGWNASPLTRADLLSNLVSMVLLVSEVLFVLQWCGALKNRSWAMLSNPSKQSWGWFCINVRYGHTRYDMHIHMYRYHSHYFPVRRKNKERHNGRFWSKHTWIKALPARRIFQTVYWFFLTKRAMTTQ